jgi:hypothetical protein
LLHVIRPQRVFGFVSAGVIADGSRLSELDFSMLTTVAYFAVRATWTRVAVTNDQAERLELLADGAH